MTANGKQSRRPGCGHRQIRRHRRIGPARRAMSRSKPRSISDARHERTRSAEVKEQPAGPSERIRPSSKSDCCACWQNNKTSGAASSASGTSSEVRGYTADKGSPADRGQPVSCAAKRAARACLIRTRPCRTCWPGSPRASEPCKTPSQSTASDASSPRSASRSIPTNTRRCSK